VDFAVLAARRSADEATRLDGGDLGYMTADEASPEFARVIREVPENGVSRPFEDSQGWHIVKIDQLRKRRPPSLEDLRETIERYLKSQQLEKIMKKLRGEADIVKRNAARSSTLDAPVAARPAPAPVERPPITAPAGTAEPVAASTLPTAGETPATPAAASSPAPATQKVTPPASAPKPVTPVPAAPVPATPGAP
jgi:peptidyl-prolyl cis-trans isomerase C